MSKKHIFGILTDFGFDFAVASIKGVLLQKFSDAQIIDIDHTIEKFNVLNAAFVINKVYSFFPSETIFICVVDPGVGSPREALCVQLGTYRFIGPNNGIFHYILQHPEARVYKIKDEAFIPSSVTFHGRDLFSPAALAIANEDWSIIESINHHDIVFLNIEEHDNLITYIDSFGNIKTNIAINSNLLTKKHLTLKINNKEILIPFVKTFTDVSIGQLLCYPGSNNTLEIAVNQGSAKAFLEANIGNKIELSY